MPKQPPEQQARRVRRSRLSQSASGNGLPSVNENQQRVIVSGDTTAPRKPFAWRAVFQTTGLIALFLASTWILLFSHWLNIRQVKLHGSTTVSQAAFNQTVDQYFEQRSWQRNILFTDTAQLADALQEAYPTFVHVNINRTVFLDLQVTVTETTPALIWHSGGQSWVIGTDGRILRPAKNGETIAGTVTDSANLPVKVGDQVANAGFVSFITDCYKQAGKYQLTIQSVTIAETTQEATLNLSNNLQVKTDTTRAASEELAAVRKAIDTANQTKKPVTKYIDVRVPGRAYYE